MLTIPSGGHCTFTYACCCYYYYRDVSPPPSIEGGRRRETGVLVLLSTPDHDSLMNLVSSPLQRLRAGPLHDNTQSTVIRNPC